MKSVILLFLFFTSSCTRSKSDIKKEYDNLILQEQINEGILRMNDTIANPVAQPHDTTKYKVTVTNSFGCKDSAELTVNVFKNPYVNAGPEMQIMKGDSVVLNGTVTGTEVNFSWSPFAYRIIIIF